VVLSRGGSGEGLQWPAGRLSSEYGVAGKGEKAHFFRGEPDD
jgi:hypothetical protein